MTRARDLAAFVSNADGDIKFDTDTLFIDSSANRVGIGTTTPDVDLSIAGSSASSQVQLSGSDTSKYNRIYGDNAGIMILSADAGNTAAGSSMRFNVDATERMRVDSNGNVGIGESSPSKTLVISENDSECVAIIKSSDTGSAGIYLGGQSDEIKGGLIFDNSSDALKFQGHNNAERARIDSSGNLLVGMTSNSVTGTGIGLVRDGTSHMYSGGTHTLELGRGTNDGDILKFNRSGTTVGSIGSTANGGVYIQSKDNDAAGPLIEIRDDGGTTNLILGATATSYGYIGDTSGNNVGAGFVSNRVQPTNASTGAGSDNTFDLGVGSARWDDIFATNTSISTSDEREKQNIASLTSAEITAATAISKLFKTYKWKDKVAAKGDAARTHTGVVAQQVETAMSDAGLDASKYAFWCSDTWWQVDGGEAYDTQEEAPEGATERNRKGIRYPELLSFIGAATEQRLTSIEARLDALEAE